MKPKTSRIPKIPKIPKILKTLAHDDFYTDLFNESHEITDDTIKKVKKISHSIKATIPDIQFNHNPTSNISPYRQWFTTMAANILPIFIKKDFQTRLSVIQFIVKEKYDHEALKNHSRKQIFLSLYSRCLTEAKKLAKIVTPKKRSNSTNSDQPKNQKKRKIEKKKNKKQGMKDAESPEEIPSEEIPSDNEPPENFYEQEEEINDKWFQIFNQRENSIDEEDKIPDDDSMQFVGCFRVGC